MSALTDSILDELIELELEIRGTDDSREEEKALMMERRALLLKKTKKGQIITSIYNLIESGQIIYKPIER